MQASVIIGGQRAVPTAAVNHIFHEPSANGEIATPPSAPLPAVPAIPDGFVAPSHDEFSRSDAERGADAVSDS